MASISSPLCHECDVKPEDRQYRKPDQKEVSQLRWPSLTKQQERIKTVEFGKTYAIFLEFFDPPSLTGRQEVKSIIPDNGSKIQLRVFSNAIRIVLGKKRCYL